MFQEISRGAGYRFHNTSLVLVEHGYNPQICFSNLLQGLLCFKILLLCKRILCLLTFNLASDSSALNDIHNLVLRDIWLRADAKISFCFPSSSPSGKITPFCQLHTMMINNKNSFSAPIVSILLQRQIKQCICKPLCPWKTPPRIN